MPNLARLQVHRNNTALTDQDAVELGLLYKKAQISFVESVRALDSIGLKLIQKKNQLAHGQWLVWLEANADALGFGKRTARLLMRGHAQLNVHLTADLTEAEAIEINRLFWGNREIARLRYRLQAAFARVSVARRFAKGVLLHRRHRESRIFLDSATDRLARLQRLHGRD